jgi:hypothetical protein
VTTQDKPQPIPGDQRVMMLPRQRVWSYLERTGTYGETMLNVRREVRPAEVSVEVADGLRVELLVAAAVVNGEPVVLMSEPAPVVRLYEHTNREALLASNLSLSHQLREETRRGDREASAYREVATELRSMRRGTVDSAKLLETMGGCDGW